jgi:hypothetical protein
MKFGVILPSFGPQSGRLAMVDTALAAESLGFDSAWTTDHLALPDSDAGQFGHIFEAVSTLGYLAAVTNSIRLAYPRWCFRSATRWKSPSSLLLWMCFPAGE